MLNRVNDVEDGVLHGGLADLQDELDGIINLSLDSQLPLAIIGRSDAREPEDRHPILLRTIVHPVVELGVGGELDVTAGGESTMAVLEISQTIVMLPNCLLNDNDPRFGIKVKLTDETESCIEEVENEVKP